MRNSSRRLARLTAQLGCCAIHTELLVCPGCDVEVDPLSEADAEELCQLLHRIGADTLPGPAHPTCPRCGGARLCQSCDRTVADITLVDGLSLQEQGRLVDLIVQLHIRMLPEVRYGTVKARN